MYGEIFGNGACEEEDKYDSGGNPEGAVEIWISIQNIEERSAGVESGSATAENFSSIDVKVLGVEAQTPQEAFRTLGLSWLGVGEGKGGSGGMFRP